MKKFGSYLIEMVIIDNSTTINMFVNPNMITNIRKSEIPTNFMTNAGSKIVDKFGEIIVSGQTKIRTEIIANVLSLNETTKN